MIFKTEDYLRIDLSPVLIFKREIVGNLIKYDSSREWKRDSFEAFKPLIGRDTSAR